MRMPIRTMCISKMHTHTHTRREMQAHLIQMVNQQWCAMNERGNFHYRLRRAMISQANRQRSLAMQMASHIEYECLLFSIHIECSHTAPRRATHLCETKCTMYITSAFGVDIIVPIPSIVPYLLTATPTTCLLLYYTCTYNTQLLHEIAISSAIRTNH